MAVQSYNPTDLPQSATNWAVAQRIVGPFAPHAQLVPNMTIMLDPGHLLSGTTLTEVNAQIAGPFAAAASRRVDRVVIDRVTGASSVVAGTDGSLTPPPIPVGKLPIARVHLSADDASITNVVIVDERSLVDLSIPNNQQVICRATLNNVNQNLPSNSTNKVLFSATDFNAGNGYDTANSLFRPSVAGYYRVTAQGWIQGAGLGYALQLRLYKNGSEVTGSISTAVSTSWVSTLVTDIVQINGTTDTVELYATQTNPSTTALGGLSNRTFFTAELIN